MCEVQGEHREHCHQTRRVLQVELFIHLVKCPLPPTKHPFNSDRASSFNPLVKHKFKKGLGPFINISGQKKATLKPWGNLMIGFPGGLGSMALLDLARGGYYSSEMDEKKRDNPRNDEILKKVTVLCRSERGLPRDTSGILYTLRCAEGRTEYMPDRTPGVVHFIKRSYPTIELVPIRLPGALTNGGGRRFVAGH